MSNESIDTQIGRAWRLQRGGQAENAVQEFERILKQAPDDIDALYGMGLAKRTINRKAEAAPYFQKALDLIETGDLTGKRLREEHVGDIGERVKPNSADEDRYMMLTRMLKQRLSELGQTG